ncbi:hypothetical protein Tco_0030656, partial [Tanacetum coccineum]
TEAEVQSLVTVPIHQDTSSVPLLTTPVIDLAVSQLHNDSSFTTNINCNNNNNNNNNSSTTFTLTIIGNFKLDHHSVDWFKPWRKETVKEAVTASVQYAMRSPLRARFKDLPTFNMKEILLQRMLEENYDKGYEDHRMAYEALQKSILHDESEQFDADKAEERKKMKSKQDSSKTPLESPPPPPPPPPPSGASGASDDQSPGSAAPSSSKPATTTAYTAWTMTTSRFEPSASSLPEDVFMHEESDFEAQDMVSDDEDIGSRHIPRVNLNQDWFKPLS